MLPDSFLLAHANERQKSDYSPGQYPGYLTPDGTWRFGENAKKIADAAWANRDRAASHQV
jgi:hypothetical protein